MVEGSNGDVKDGAELWIGRYKNGSSQELYGINI